MTSVITMLYLFNKRQACGVFYYIVKYINMLLIAIDAILIYIVLIVKPVSYLMSLFIVPNNHYRTIAIIAFSISITVIFPMIFAAFNIRKEKDEHIAIWAIGLVVSFVLLTGSSAYFMYN